MTSYWHTKVKVFGGTGALVLFPGAPVLLSGASGLISEGRLSCFEPPPPARQCSSTISFALLNLVRSASSYLSVNLAFHAFVILLSVNETPEGRSRRAKAYANVGSLISVGRLLSCLSFCGCIAFTDVSL